MDWMRTLLSRIRSVFRSPQLDADLDEELKAHIDLAIAENLQQGMTAEKARTAALRAFGGVTQIREAYRVQRGLPWFQTAARNIRIAIRQLRRSPGFAITAILTLAFGIGATTAIFSIVDGVLLRPLPFPDASRLVTLGDQVSGGQMGEHGDPGWVTAPEVVTYQRDTLSFQSLGGFGLEGYELSGVDHSGQIVAARMTPSVFSVLGVAPFMGRVFNPQEDTQKAQVVVLSYVTWKSRFNANPQVIGTKIDLNRRPYIVIGVMPRNFEFPINAGRLNRCELWVPMSFSAGGFRRSRRGIGISSWSGGLSPASPSRRRKTMRSGSPHRLCATIRPTYRPFASGPWFIRCTRSR
jgi:hypothetical protein